MTPATWRLVELAGCAVAWIIYAVFVVVTGVLHVANWAYCKVTK